MLSPKLFGLIPAIDVNYTHGIGNSFLVFLLIGNGNNEFDEKMVEFIDFLISQGFNMNIQNQDGMSSLYTYIQNGKINVELVEVVIKKGADPNIATSEYNFTPLIKAAQLGFISCVRMLVEHKANIRHKDIWGFTAIDYAKSFGMKEVVDFLDSQGAKINENSKDTLKTCCWYTGAETWEQLVEYFTRREIRYRIPDLNSLHKQLKRFPAEQQHSAWIHVGQALYDKIGSHRLTSCCYIEALNADPDPSSVAWSWLDGTYDQSMSLFLTYNGAKPLKAQLQSVIKNWGVKSLLDTCYYANRPPAPWQQPYQLGD